VSRTPITDLITEMLKNCIPNEMIIVAVRSMEVAMSTRKPVDETAEKRRAWDREYRRRKREMSADPPDNHPKTPDVGVAASSFLEEDKKHAEVEVKKEKKKRGEKLPPDWMPKEAHYLEGEKRGICRARIDDLADNMRTWAAANANRSITTKADWDATFMGFIRREPSHGHTTGNHRTNSAAGSQQSGSDAILAGVVAAKERRARERQQGQLPESPAAPRQSDPQLI